MIQGRKILALVCARGGSKGIPGKNLRQLGGKPLVRWSIDSARACPLIDRLVVSTDSSEIAEIALAGGAEVPFLRPAELAADRSPEWMVWQHALKELGRRDDFRPDYLVVLPPTSPFRSPEDIAKGIALVHEGGADIIISVTESTSNPYFNMVELDRDGFAVLSKRPDGKVTRRQDAPAVYDITTVLYTARCDFVLDSTGIFEGKVKTVIIPDVRALDIDTELDLKFAEFLLSQGTAGSR